MSTVSCAVPAACHSHAAALKQILHAAAVVSAIHCDFCSQGWTQRLAWSRSAWVPSSIGRLRFVSEGVELEACVG